MPVAYHDYDHGRRENVHRSRAWLGENDIVLAGRYIEREYNNSDHAFIAGKKAALMPTSELMTTTTPNVWNSIFFVQKERQKKIKLTAPIIAPAIKVKCRTPNRPMVIIRNSAVPQAK